MGRTEERTEVAVIGGGTAGSVAAIQAARAGAKTAVIDANARLGGTMTVGGVCCAQWFFAGSRQVIGGVGWEMLNVALALEDRPLPDFSTPGDRPGKGVPFNGHLLSLVMEEAAVAAGVDLHYHETVTDVEDLGGAWKVTSVGKGLRRETIATELIDCTGDADAVALAGLRRERSDVRQPGTLMFTLSGYDPDSLDEELIEQRYRQALAEGRLQPGDFWRADKPFGMFLRQRGANAQHIHGADSTTSATQTEANLRGRASLLRLLRFVRTLPGCHEAHLVDMREATAVRETWRIAGESTITEQDYLSGRVFPDAVAYTYYFVDVHTAEGVEKQFIPDGRIPTLPLSAMVPAGSSRILAAGRCISSDRRANSGLRVEASCMAMGQAAGAAAALGVRTGTASRNVDIKALRSVLREHSAIVPEPE